MKRTLQLLLLLIPIMLFVTNVHDGKYILGWDNFNSELSPSLAISQALHAGWSDFRSMGLVAGMGYATDLLHAIGVWILSHILPNTFIRPVILFSLLAIGGQGVFALLIESGATAIAAFIGALYAMLSFGTVQIFSLPYEPFSAFFAFFPWSILYWLKTIQDWNKTNILVFLLITVAISSAMYVQTLFIVYMLCIGVLLIATGFSQKEHWSNLLRRSACLFVCIGLIHSYWLFTQLYFLFTHVDIVQNAKQILLGWRVPYFQNAAHSSLFDFLTQYGYYTEFNGGSGKIFSLWIDHLSQPIILITRSIIALVLLIGIIDGKNKYKSVFVGLCILHAIALLPTTPGFSQLNELLRQIPTLDQIFRSPFSKFVMSQSIIFGFCIGMGIDAIHHAIQSKKYVHNGISILLCAGIVFASFPAFTGHFFANEVTVAIPDVYRELFTFFAKVSPTAKLTILPESDVWGWYGYTWGYQGSGFLWHAIAQPIVSRSYDVWSRSSENEFLEVKRAIHAENIESLISVYKKYDIEYILFDEHLIVDKKAGQLTYKTIDRMSRHPDISVVWKKDGLTVFHLNSLSKTPLSLLSNAPNIGPLAYAQIEDIAYSRFGTYVTDSTKPFDVYMPYRDVQTQTFTPNPAWSLTEHDTYFSLVTPVHELHSYVSSTDSGSFIAEAIVASGSGYTTVSIPVTVSKTNTAIRTIFPKIRVTPNSHTDPKNCSDQAIQNPFNFSYIKNIDEITVTTRYGHMGCFGYNFDNESLRNAYIVKTNAVAIAGQPLMMYVTDHTNIQTIVQHQLNAKTGTYFLLPPGAPDAIGLSINFQNVSYLRTPSINKFRQPELYLFPYNLLSTVLRNSDRQISPATITPISLFEHPNPAFFKIESPLRPAQRDFAGQAGMTSTVVLSQSFDDGWVALIRSKGFPFVKMVGQHVLVNNWENGWVLQNETIDPRLRGDDKSVEVILFFWPQLLEYLGFLLLPLPFLWVIFKRE